MALPLAVGLGAMGLNVIGNIYQGYQAGERERRSMRELSRLQRIPLPRYEMGDAMKRYGAAGYSDYINPQGFTAGERSSFINDLGVAGATALGNARSVSGGQGSRAILGLNNANITGALNRFASQGASLRRQQRMGGLNRMYQFASVDQDLRNRNTSADINRRLITEQAYGAAARQNRDLQAGIYQGLLSDVGGLGASLTTMSLMNPRQNLRNSRYGVGSYIGDPSYGGLPQDPTQFIPDTAIG